MMLIIQSINPVESVCMLPNSIKFKQLVELMQLLSSCSLTDVYKPIPQGKELQKWILNNINYTTQYLQCLSIWVVNNINLKEKTKNDINKCIIDLLNNKNYNFGYNINIKNVVFRYSKQYKTHTPTDSLLPIYKGLEEYKKYVQWKINNKIWR